MPPRLQRAVIRGVPLIVIEDPALPLVGFFLGLRHGAGLDRPGRSGELRTMLELLLRGTSQRDRRQFNDAVEELGSSLGTAAGHELAYLRGACLKRHLDATWDLLGEALVDPAFAQDELEDLVDETCEELRAARDDDDSVADIFLRRTLHEGHVFARGAAGEIADLVRLGPDDVRTAWRERLRADDMVVAFAGDVTLAEATRRLEALLDRLPKTGPTAAAVPQPQSVDGLRLVVVDKPERTQVQMRLGRLVCSGREPDALALWLAALAFGGTFTSPLMHEVRELRGWSYGASASYDRRRLMRSPFLLASAPGLADAADCLALELSMWKTLAEGTLAPEAVAQARSYALNRFPFQIATAADLLVPAVRGELLGEPLAHLLDFPERLAAVPDPGLAGVLRRQLHPEGVTAVLVAPAASLVPELKRRWPAAEIRTVDFRDGLDEAGA